MAVILVSDLILFTSVDIQNALCKATVAYAFRVAYDKSAVGLPESRE